VKLRSDFGKLWASQSVSALGTEITALALPLTAMYVLHADAFQVGLLGTAQWLPFLLVALWAGAWTDRRRKRPVIIATDLARAAILGVVVVAGVTGMLTFGLLLGLVFAFGVCTVLFEVAYPSYLPSVVPKAALVDANSRLQISESVAYVSGPAIGGALVTAFTAPVALVADAVSFVASALGLAWIPTREPAPATPAVQTGLLRDIGSALGYIWRTPVLRALIGTSALYNVFAQWFTVLFALFAVTQLGLSTAQLGLTLSAAAVGSLLGSAVAIPVSRRIGVGPATLWSILGECLALLIVPLTPGGHATTVPLLIIAFGLNGMGITLSRVMVVSLRQTITPHHLLGRVNATHRFVSFGLLSIGSLLGGLAGQWLGLRAGIAIGAAGTLTSVVWIVATGLHRVRELPTADEPELESDLAELDSREVAMIL
jgi:MFS family permease